MLRRRHMQVLCMSQFLYFNEVRYAFLNRVLVHRGDSTNSHVRSANPASLVARLGTSLLTACHDAPARSARTRFGGHACGWRSGYLWSVGFLVLRFLPSVHPPMPHVPTRTGR